MEVAIKVGGGLGNRFTGNRPEIPQTQEAASAQPHRVVIWLKTKLSWVLGRSSRGTHQRSHGPTDEVSPNNGQGSISVLRRFFRFGSAGGATECSESSASTVLGCILGHNGAVALPGARSASKAPKTSYGPRSVGRGGDGSQTATSRPMSVLSALSGTSIGATLSKASATSSRPGGTSSGGSIAEISNLPHLPQNKSMKFTAAALPACEPLESAADEASLSKRGGGSQQMYAAASRSALRCLMGPRLATARSVQLMLRSPASSFSKSASSDAYPLRSGGGGSPYSPRRALSRSNQVMPYRVLRDRVDEGIGPEASMSYAYTKPRRGRASDGSDIGISAVARVLAEVEGRDLMAAETSTGIHAMRRACSASECHDRQSTGFQNHRIQTHKRTSRLCSTSDNRDST